eukprot:4200634-Amphidinium_carterae.2
MECSATLEPKRKDNGPCFFSYSDLKHLRSCTQHATLASRAGRSPLPGHDWMNSRNRTPLQPACAGL